LLHCRTDNKVEHTAKHDVIGDSGTGAKSDPGYEPAERVKGEHQLRRQSCTVSHGNVQRGGRGVRSKARRQQPSFDMRSALPHRGDEFAQERAADDTHLGFRMPLERSE
jgi:hypothetical protein